MARHIIQHGSTGEIRTVGDGALPYFPGWFILDTLEDGQPANTFYDAAAADFRYVNVTELGDDDSPAMVALRAALVPRPAGGVDGQVIVKSGSDVAWGTVSGGSAGPEPEAPLGQIAKAQTGPFRVFMTATSIGSFDRAPNQVIAEQLKTTYGDSALYTVRAGELGGSFTAAYQGWEKQRFSGPFYYRLRGKSTSTAIAFPFYSDQVTTRFSRETNSEAADILIDGVVVGQTPAAGAQAYGQAQTFTTTLGPHTVTLNPPVGGGFVYFEWMEAGTSTRRGVEVIDATVGGSTLGAMVNTPAAATGQAASIPVVGDNGIDAHFTRTDVDVFVVSHTVNDAGSAPLTNLQYVNETFIPTMDKAVAKTKALRRPLVIIIEMAGHYALPNDNGDTKNHTAYDAVRGYLLSLRSHNHVTVIDHHAATIMDDLAAYAARYYPAVTGLNVAAGTFTGDFIHAEQPGPQIGTALMARALGIPVPRRALGSEIRADRLRTLPMGVGLDKKATVAGAAKRYPVPSGPAFAALAGGTSSAYQGVVVPYYRDSTAVNAAASTQAAIDASGTADAYGKYLDSSNRAVGVGSGWDTVSTRTITMRASGTVAIRATGTMDIYANGVALPRSDVANGRTQIRYVLSGSEPVVFTATLHSTVNNPGLDITGRIYEIAVTDSDVPLFV